MTTKCGVGEEACEGEKMVCARTRSPFDVAKRQRVRFLWYNFDVILAALLHSTGSHLTKTFLQQNKTKHHSARVRQLLLPNQPPIATAKPACARDTAEAGHACEGTIGVRDRGRLLRSMERCRKLCEGHWDEAESMLACTTREKLRCGHVIARSRLCTFYSDTRSVFFVEARQVLCSAQG